MRIVKALKTVSLEGGLTNRFSAPDGSSGAIAKEAGTDDDTGIIIEVESSGTDFDGDNGDFMTRICRQVFLCGTQRGDGGPASHADKVQQVTSFPEARLLGDVAAQPGAQVSGACTDNEAIQFLRAELCFLQSLVQCPGAKSGRLPFKDAIQFFWIRIEDRIYIRVSEVTCIDSVITQKNFPHQVGRSILHAQAGFRTIKDITAILLGITCLWNSCLEGKEVHQLCVKWYRPVNGTTFAREAWQVMD